MEENKLSIPNEISNEEIKNLIYIIRGEQVMLDSDVAMLYNYETKKVIIIEKLYFIILDINKSLKYNLFVHHFKSLKHKYIY